MTSGAIEKLYFSIGLIDQLTGPSKGVARSIQKIQQTVKTGIKDIVKGGGAVGGMTFSLLRATGEARDFDKAMKEVAALDAPRREVLALGRAGKQFAMEFGGAAADVVRSGYDIQSSIQGLDNGELARFTYNSAVLAKATKADAATITGYMSTMSDIDAETMARIGKAKWVDQLTGKTAKAVQMFRTTGSEMQAAFARLGSVGVAHNVGLDEQMAILGMLQQTTGSGAEAATQYKAFLTGLNNADAMFKKIGISLTDVEGKALPMADILDKIRGKFGDTLNEAEFGALKQAFGSDEAVKAITGLLKKTDALRGNVKELTKIKGMDLALKMAAEQTDPLERLAGVGKVLAITFGQILLPGINLVLGGIARLGIGLNWLMEYFPPLRWLIGLVVAGVVALTFSWGIMKIAIGAMGLWNALILKLRLVNASLWKMNVITGRMSLTQKIAATANWLWSKSLGSAALWSKLAAAATWLFNAALWANPVTWIVVGIMALIGAVVALIYYWKDICGWFGVAYDWCANALPAAWNWLIGLFKSAWGWFSKACPNLANLLEKLFAIWWAGVTAVYQLWKGVFLGIFTALGACFSWIGDLAAGVWDGITGGIEKVYTWLADMLLPVVQAVGNMFGWLGDLGSLIWSGITSVFSGIDGFIGRILRTLARIPGLGFLDPDVKVNQTAKIEQPVVPSVAAARKTDVAAGGVRNTNNNKINNWGGVTINTSSRLGPGEIEDMLALQA
ncbi:MAG: phage tail tape measure protein [Victivallaceae bacterium]|nr:phage tail tape measure protein [Victivallaceae bacterium]